MESTVWYDRIKEGAMKTILFIEDEKQLQTGVYAGLTKAGYTVLQAFDGKTGLERVEDGKPDLVLLDIMLPGGLNGFDVLERMKLDDRFKAIPVIMLTNLDSEAATAINAGAADYIVKTNISLEALAQRIHAMIGT